MPNYKRKATSGAKPAQAAMKAKTSSSTMRTSKSSTSKVSAPVAKQLTMTKSSMSTCRYAEIERVNAQLAPNPTAVGPPATNTADFKVITGATNAINPGIATAVPWLSQHAKLYEKYRFKKLVYRFKTVSPTTAAGQIMLGWEMDPADDLPVNAAAMAQLAKYADGPVWQKLSLSIPCDQEWRYIAETESLNAGQDKRMAHLGRFNVALADCDTVAAKGYIEVEYVVEFKGKATATGAVSPSRQVVQFRNSAAEVVGGDIRLTDIPGNVFGTPSASGGILLKPGNYMITAQPLGGSGGPTTGGYFTVFNAGVEVQRGGSIATGSSLLPLSQFVTVPAGASNIVHIECSVALTAAAQVSMTIELL